MKKILSLVLALAMVLSLFACAPNADNNESQNPVQNSEPAGDENSAVPVEPGEFTPLTYDYEELFDPAMGEFYEMYSEARLELDDMDLRYAKMALAEGKLLGTGMMLPDTAKGGSYAMSRVAPRTVSGVLYGNDSDRFHQAILTTELIKASDRTAMVDKWREVETADEYEAWAKQYLVDQGYTLKDTYNYIYSSDPITWDIFASSNATEGEVLVNTFDGLMEYDIKDTLQPALAESYTVSEDGLVYTFKLREGVIWTDSQGREVDKVTADDFVAGMQHLMDAKGGLEELLSGVIVGATGYIGGEITDFSQVGVKAVDEYTVEYTLEAPTPYFMTMLGYSIFAPMSRSYYESQGGKFGKEYKTEDSGRTYGTGPDHIAYCGPYLVTNATANNTIVFQASPSYWNADKINVKTLTWVFQDGSEVTKTYTDLKSGVVDGASLNSSTIKMARDEGLFDEYVYTSATDATSYYASFNLARLMFHNYNDPAKLVSTQSHGSVDEILAARKNGEEANTSDIEDDAARTHIAVNNRHFRLAMIMALDRGDWNAQIYSDELKFNPMRNTYVPGTFVHIENEVTVDVNGTPTTFPAGTQYGEIVQAQITADGLPIKVWDTSTGAEDPSTGFDGWYNLNAAKEQFELAKQELAAVGVEVSAENPIQIDFPFAGQDERYANRAQVFVKCMNEAFGGAIQVNLLEGASFQEMNDSSYFPESGAEMNFDYTMAFGWGPDWGDPNSYLDQILPYGEGFMQKGFGLW